MINFNDARIIGELEAEIERLRSVNSILHFKIEQARTITPAMIERAAATILGTHPTDKTQARKLAEAALKAAFELPVSDAFGGPFPEEEP